MDPDSDFIKSLSAQLLKNASTPGPYIGPAYSQYEHQSFKNNWIDGGNFTPNESMVYHTDITLKSDGSVFARNQFGEDKHVYYSETETHNDQLQEDLAFIDERIDALREHQQVRLMQLIMPIQPTDGVDVADLW
jgi:hypothetical protein